MSSQPRPRTYLFARAKQVLYALAVLGQLAFTLVRVVGLPYGLFYLVCRSLELLGFSGSRWTIFAAWWAFGTAIASYGAIKYRSKLPAEERRHAAIWVPIIGASGPFAIILAGPI